jgi:hypothetical protein
MAITICPKCAYARQSTDGHIHAGVCPSCGIAYQKFLDRQRMQNANGEVAGGLPRETPLPQDDPRLVFLPALSLSDLIKARLTDVPAQVDPTVFWSRVAILTGLELWGTRFVFAGINWEVIGGSFLHNIILPFHEFGHVLFIPFGRFMTILGGSLFQVTMPLGLMAVFVFQQRDNFAGAVMLWWSGQSFIDLSPYIADAVERSLPLVGGGGEDSHDWGNLLTMMHALPHTQAVARASFVIGTLLMVGGLVWGGYVLLRQHKRLMAV